MRLSFHRAAIAALLLELPISAQPQLDRLTGAPAPILAGTAAHGLPGSVPGTERWIVHFETRSFDLKLFREAVQERRSPAEMDQIIADMKRAMSADQAPFVAALESLGGRIQTQWWLVNAAAVEINPIQLDALRRLQNVAYLQPDERVEPTILTATNANNHNADAVQAQGFRGLGVATAIIDTGQDSNMGGQGRPHRTYFVNGDPNNNTGGGIGGSRLVLNRQMGAVNPDDVQGHGTGVASIVAGADWGTAFADDGHAPLASIAGYAIAQNTLGGSTTAVMMSAWQQVAADRVQYNIVTANNSYDGSPDPLDGAQQALDSAALNADILCCVSAGNRGITISSQSAANGLAVTAINPDAHTVAWFSSRGPMWGDIERFYPDIAGCGVSTIMARRDSEGSDYVDSGTSMSAPQVCGAATQLRGRFSSLTALETKAILLASTSDIASQNGGLTRNDFGMGILRNDRANALASSGNFGTMTVTAAAPAASIDIPTTAGQTFAIAITWHRLNVASTSWSDLDLEVLDGSGALIASAATPRNLYEMIRFRSPFNGILTVRAIARSIAGGSSQAVAFAWTDSPGAHFKGLAQSYGAGCLGTGQPTDVCASINPNGGALTNFTQQSETCYDLVAPSTLQVNGFEVFSQSTSAAAPVTVSAAIYLSAGVIPSTVPLATTTVRIGAIEGFYVATFAAPVSIPAGPFWIGIDHTAQTTYLSNLRLGSYAGGYCRSTFGFGGWAPSGLVTVPSLRVRCAGGGGAATPLHSASWQPTIGQSFDVGLSQAAPNSSVVLLIGVSASTWPGGSLPFSFTSLGAPGCSLLTSTEVVLSQRTDGQGNATRNFSISNQASLIGQFLFSQYLVLDPRANALGLATSNGLRMTIGN